MQQRMVATAKMGDTNSVTGAIIQLMRSRDVSEEKIATIDKSLTKLDAPDRNDFAFFIGKELSRLGKEKEAEKYWRQTLASHRCTFWYYTLAGFELAKRHGTSRPDGDVPGKVLK